MKKEFTLRLDDAACAELENLKKLSGEKTIHGTHRENEHKRNSKRN